jgi:hypothetical protein
MSANYSARLRQPEVLDQIRAILRRVAAESTPPVQAAYILSGPDERLRSQLRGITGMLMKDAGFRTRDVAELFGQNKYTTHTQIRRAGSRFAMPA